MSRAHTPPAWARRRSGAVALALLLAACGGGGGGATPPSPPPPEPRPVARDVRVWLTTGDQTRLLSREADLSFGADTGGRDDVRLDVDTAATFQTMLGFGAAMTDASAWLIQRRMSAAQREALLQDLFGRGAAGAPASGPAPPGIGLGVVRIPMGASDFSRTHYSYADERDPTLASFSIEPDRAEKLPALRGALAVNPALYFVASPWSPPGWMKTSNSLVTGTLRDDMHQPFAQYFVRFLRAYRAEGVRVRALTVQNEPDFEPKDYPGMRLNAPARARVIGTALGPALADAGEDVQIWDWDHNWDKPEEPRQVLADPVAARYVQGVAWHCYAGDVSAQSTVRELAPTKDVHFTECSGGEWAPDFAPNLAWNVGTLIVGTTRHWARSVLLWNLALDQRGGPHLGGCGNCRGVVTIDSATGSYRRNVEYFALGHASRFVRPGAVRVGSSSGVQGVVSVAFRNADDGSKVLVVANTAAAARPVQVRWAGRAFRFPLPATSAATFVWD